MNDTSTADTILVNGESAPLGEGMLAALLEERGLPPDGRGIAIAINGAVVPRAAWRERRLAAGDKVEIVQAKQGG